MRRILQGPRAALDGQTEKLLEQVFGTARADLPSDFQMQNLAESISAYLPPASGIMVRAAPLSPPPYLRAPTRVLSATLAKMGALVVVAGGVGFAVYHWSGRAPASVEAPIVAEVREVAVLPNVVPAQLPYMPVAANVPVSSRAMQARRVVLRSENSPRHAARSVDSSRAVAEPSRVLAEPSRAVAEPSRVTLEAPRGAVEGARNTGERSASETAPTVDDTAVTRAREPVAVAAHTTVPEPPAREKTLAVRAADTELSMLLEARRLSSADPERGLALIDEHRHKFGGSELGQERDLIAIDALIALGRTGDARQLAKQFRRRYPGSAHFGRLQVLEARLGS